MLKCHFKKKLNNYDEKIDEMLKLIEPLRIVEYGEFLHNKVKELKNEK